MNDPLEKLQADLRAIARTPAPVELKERIAKELASPSIAARSGAAHRVTRENRFVPLPGNPGVLECAIIVLVAAFLVYFAIDIQRSYKQKTAPVLADDGLENKIELSPEDRERIARLVKQLSSDDFGERQAAQVALEKFSELALPVIESLTRGQADEDLHLRLQTITRRIRCNGNLARLEAIAPGSRSKLDVADPGERFNAVLAWVKTVDRVQVAPVLVEIANHADPSPLHWSACNALNFWADSEVFLNADVGTWNWSSKLPLIREVLRSPEFNFSDDAARLCAPHTAPAKVQEQPAGRLLSLVLADTGAAFYSTPDGKYHIVTQAEAALHWRQWWNEAKKTIEWQKDVPDAAMLNAWVQSLRGEDHRAILRDRLRIIDGWDRPEVRSAIQKLAQEGGPAAQYANEILAAVTLRSSGKILFNNEGEANVWMMNPDGSRQEPLFVKDAKGGEWHLREVSGNKVLLANEANGLFWWTPGQPRPQLIEESGVSNAIWRGSTSQVIYLANVYDTSRSWVGGLKIFDVNTGRNVEVPSALNSGVEEIRPSPDGAMIAFTRQTQGKQRSVFTYNIKTNEIKLRMSFFDAFGVRSSTSFSDWSADSQWLSHFGYEAGQNEPYSLVQNVQTGVARRFEAGSTWMSTGAQMLLVGRDERTVKLFDPPETFTELKDFDLPQGVSHLQPLTADLIIGNGHYREGGLWRVVLTPKPSIQELEAMRLVSADSIIAIDNKWLLVGARRLPGTNGGQIGLVSVDGSIGLALTNRPGGCSNPVFVRSWKKE